MLIDFFVLLLFSWDQILPWFVNFSDSMLQKKEIHKMYLLSKNKNNNNNNKNDNKIKTYLTASLICSENTYIYHVGKYF